MAGFGTARVGAEASGVAPDGTAVRDLLALAGGSMAHFTLPAGSTSLAVTHRTVEEIWLVLEGRGELWRKQDAAEAVTPLEPGVAVTIPLGTRFQFRSLADAPLTFVAITMPPWPGADEAVPVEGAWAASVG